MQRGLGEAETAHCVDGFIAGARKETAAADDERRFLVSEEPVGGDVLPFVEEDGALPDSS